MRKRCLAGKTGNLSQKRLLTYLMKGMISVSSPLVATSDFQARIENARQKFSTHPKPDELKESVIDSFSACFVAGNRGDE